MKLAIAADGTEVAAHFGRCEKYVLAEIEDGEVGAREDMANPGHEPGRLPRMLHDLGVDCIAAGGMGPRAVNLFAQLGIQPIVGVSGSVDDCLAAAAAGELEAGETTCHH